MEFKTEAGNNSSISNEMLFVVYDSKSADPTTYPDYAYVCDVYVNDELKARLISRPYPDTNMGVFDVSRVLSGCISYSFKAGNDIEDYSPMLSYKLKIGEQYDGTIYTNILEDANSRTCFNTYSVKPYQAAGVVLSGLVSNMPLTINVYEKETDPKYLFLPYFSNVSGVSNLTATYYDSNGGVLNTQVFDNSDFTVNNIRQFRIEQVDPDRAYILFTGPFTLRANYHCSKYPVVSLVWLNSYGGYESQTFGMVSKKTLNVDRKQYTRKPYEINASGVVSYFSENVYYGGKRGYYSIAKYAMQLTSHLLNADEYTWLADLFISPEVYIELTNEVFVPVVITDTGYEYRTYQNSRLTPLQFTIEFSDIDNSQLL